MKPHIRRVSLLGAVLWACAAFGEKWVYGSTPRAAYLNWHNWNAQR